MKKSFEPARTRSLAALLALGLLTAGIIGCESDSTAPQDGAPALTEEGAATQAGQIAMAMTQVGPEMITFSLPGKTVYDRTFNGLIAGTVHLDFRMGGADGASATWATGTWARLFTDQGAPLVIAIGDQGGTAQLGLDITGDLNRVQDTAVINGGGTFASGPYSAAFVFDDLAVAAASDYPGGGTLTFTAGSWVVAVAFDGSNIATMTVTGHGTWYVNLDTGEVSQNV